MSFKIKAQELNIGSQIWSSKNPLRCICNVAEIQ